MYEKNDTLVQLKMPGSLKVRATEAAKKDNRSLSSFIRIALQRSLTQEQAV